MKQCKSCNQVKFELDFHARASAKDGLQSRCKDCNKQQRKDYYKTAHGRAQNTFTGKRYYTHNAKRIFEYLLEHPCVDCNESNPVVLEFDHRDPSKKSYNVCSKFGYDKSWSNLQLEIAKCDVRCSNCHKKRTAEQFGHLRLAWMQANMVD